ncbi:MAG TPA: cytochrome P450 [Spirillospora sp.]|nr:cytochrome P450 [Spirillospora sp.]
MDFPLPHRPGVPLDPGHLRRLRERPLTPVRLPGGHDALLVTRHADVRAVLAGGGFGREAWTGGTLFARDAPSLALVASDPPTHTRRRRAVQARFTARRAEADRPRAEALAERLLDDLETAGPPADLLARFATPLPYALIRDMLGVPAGDLGRLLPWTGALMSAGHVPAGEVEAARAGMFGYFSALLDARRAAIDAGDPGDDLLTGLLADPGERLTAEEITVFGLGLFMAGGETTSNFLAACVLELIARPDLAAALRADPGRVPAAVEEFLRWVWFGGTGGRPHVVLAGTRLGGTALRRGDVVVPLTDAADRDPDAFRDADAFRPDRSPNPHLGFGHGRHMCLGAPHARMQLQVAITALLRRFDRLDLAIDPARLRWRERMFVRGVWELPVTWRPRR